MATVTPMDLFLMLTPSERQQVLESLQQEQSPCERSGHRYKPVGVVTKLFGAIVKNKLVCEKCGQVKIV